MENDQNQSGGDPGLIVKTGDDFDPKELAERIKERVRQKMESGFYDRNDIDWIAKFKPTVPEEFEKSNQHLLHLLNATWDVAGAVDMDTHRTGAAAKLIKLAKKLYQALVHRFLKFSFTKQTKFNQVVKDAIEEVFNLRVRSLHMSQRLSKIDERLSTLEGQRVSERLEERLGLVDERFDIEDGRLDKLEKMRDFTVADLVTRVGDLEKNLKESVESLNRSLRDVDKQGIFIKKRLADSLEKLGALGPADKNLAAAVERERSRLDAYDYQLFESIHRGAHDEIKNKLKPYLGWFKGAKDVLDIGCGRGELIELFNENGIDTRGLDVNEEAVEECKSRGLDAEAGDALAYLESLPDNSLGGLTAVQFVEHLPVDTMTRFFELAHAKLRFGAPIAAETINAACLTTFCSAFYVDLSHYKPIHPLALQFLLERIGFEDVRIEYLNPQPEDIRLQPLPVKIDGKVCNARVIEEFNRNVMKLNNVLYSHTDYAIVARR